MTSTPAAGGHSPGSTWRKWSKYTVNPSGETAGRENPLVRLTPVASVRTSPPLLSSTTRSWRGRVTATMPVGAGATGPRGRVAGPRGSVTMSGELGVVDAACVVLVLRFVTINTTPATMTAVIAPAPTRPRVR